MEANKETEPVLYQYFKSTANVLLSEYVRSAQQNASTNLGKNREMFCSDFLNKVLPSKLRIKSGEIWDSKSNKTGQLDLVILRDDCPSLNIGTDDIYLVEGVFAVIEVKSNLTRNKLIEAGKSFEKVKKLEINHGAVITSGAHIDRPLRLVFAYEGAGWDIIVNEIQKNKWEELFDLICILDTGVLLTKGRLYNWTGKHTFQVINGKAIAIGMLYFYLVCYGSSFLGRNLILHPYFEPLNAWKE